MTNPNIVRFWVTVVEIGGLKRYDGIFSEANGKNISRLVALMN